MDSNLSEGVGLQSELKHRERLLCEVRVDKKKKKKKLAKVHCMNCTAIYSVLRERKIKPAVDLGEQVKLN